MSWYKRSKLAFDSFRKSRDFTCKVTPKNNPIQNAQSFTYPCSISHLNRRYPVIESTKDKLTPFLCGARRNYCVDQRLQVTHFCPRGDKRNLIEGIVLSAIAFFGTGLAAAVYFGNLVTVPYTNRTHFVPFSYYIENQSAEAQFKRCMESFKGKILPATHPESVRVRLIAKDIIHALQRGLSKENVSTDLGYASDSTNLDNTDGLISLSEDNKNDDFVDDKLVEKSWKKGKHKGNETATEHWESFNWEIFVVEEPKVKAFCVSSGKIFVCTGLLDRFKSDDEISTILGHEMAHVLGRHDSETLTKKFWIGIVMAALSPFVTFNHGNPVYERFLRRPFLAGVMSLPLLSLFFSRKSEIEADYIGLMLMASAGYDPRVAPGVYKKLDEICNETSTLYTLLRSNMVLSTHPSGKKRAMLLAESKAMEEALVMYQDRTLGRRD